MKWWYLVLPLSIVGLAWVIWKRRWLMAEITGSVPGTPEELAAAAGFDVDVYSLARVGQSEESGLGSICVMFATKTEAKRSKLTPTQLVTRARMKDEDGIIIPAPGDGQYGTQKHRFCSTAQDPSDDMLEKAGQVWSSSIADPTNGAHHWDAPELQDKEHEIDPINHPSSEEIASRREASGWSMVLVDGVSKTRFWR